MQQQVCDTGTILFEIVTAMSNAGVTTGYPSRGMADPVNLRFHHHQVGWQARGHPGDGTDFRNGTEMITTFVHFFGNPPNTTKIALTSMR